MMIHRHLVGPREAGSCAAKAAAAAGSTCRAAPGRHGHAGGVQCADGLLAAGLRARVAAATAGVDGTSPGRCRALWCIQLRTTGSIDGSMMGELVAPSECAVPLLLQVGVPDMSSQTLANISTAPARLPALPQTQPLAQAIRAEFCWRHRTGGDLPKPEEVNG